MGEKQTLNPDPEVLIMGLRDTGYDTNTALADVVDNSVDADANHIEVTINLDIKKKPYVYIADDGCGMDKEELLDGMKYGSSSTKAKAQRRLGKFGLGMKTASTAFCRKLSVISKKNENDPLWMATWDLDEVVADRDWVLLVTEEKDIPEQYKRELNKVMKKGHGTLVVWEKVDRFANGAVNKKNIDTIAKNFSQYASMIYHRFIDKEDKRARNLEIKVNGILLAPWDPFCLAEKRKDDTGTILHSECNKEVSFVYEDDTVTSSKFHLAAYVLPNKDNFSSTEAMHEARITNRNMGFYVYRENRMIADGDWLGIRSTDPHDSLCRIEFSFDHTLDDAFKIDVKKSKIMLAPDLSDYLEKWVKKPVKVAEDRYRKNQDKKMIKDAAEIHADANKAIKRQEFDAVVSKIEVVGACREDGKQDIAVRNKETGAESCVVTIRVAPDEVPGVVVQIDDVEYGALWEPSYRDGHHCVIINPKHAFYKKVIFPNKKQGIALQGFDSLIWSLAEAELGTINEQQKNQFKNFRMQVSSILTQLVSDLPDPVL